MTNAPAGTGEGGNGQPDGSPGIDDIARELARIGSKLTAPRRVVVQSIIAFRKPFTSEQLVDACPGAGRATVYRTLDLLLSVGVVSRIAGSEGRGRYMLGTPGHWHHLICVGCGETIAFSSCPVSDLVADLARSTGFTIEGHLLEVFGRCPACLEALPRTDALLPSPTNTPPC